MSVSTIFNKKYRAVKELGKGAYGTIKLAEDITQATDMEQENSSDRYVAIKQMMISVNS